MFLTSTGAQIILSMKIIGVGFDHGNGTVEKLPDVAQFLGYCLNVGSVIFGPWVSYQDYLQTGKLDYRALVSRCNTCQHTCCSNLIKLFI